MKKTLLMILDGWGLATDAKVSAVDQAHTPFVDGLRNKYANSRLEASGLAVGLPEGQMGNSEVGHMNIGAGRVVYQDLVKINLAIEDGSLGENPVLEAAFDYCRRQDKPFHLMGLVSDGGVHAHLDHLKALCTLAQAAGVRFFVHAFTDGRDTDPRNGQHYLADLEAYLQNTRGRVASVIGRYYAMDRDQRWERVRLAYDLLVHGQGQAVASAAEACRLAYADDVTDEFVRPAFVADAAGQPLATLRPGDAVLCFNFRTDRGRQLTQVLTQRDFPEHQMQALALHYLTLTNYDDTFRDVAVLFQKDSLENTLGEVLAKAGKTQIRIAETEKYPHVTFFFSGGREAPFEGERRILCPSPKVATYDLQPEMSAADIRDRIIAEIEQESADFICLNFANPDMVGHTGVFEATVRACEMVDQCAERVVSAALAHGYATLVIADHGNADYMINPDGSPNTAHSTNLVPCILVDNHQQGQLRDGKLGDLAPTLLDLMGIEKPAQMTGTSLLAPQTTPA